MLGFGSNPTVEFLPDDEARAWVAEGLRDHLVRLGPVARQSALIDAAPSPAPKTIDDLFEVICGVQAQVGQRDVEFTMIEMGPDTPDLQKSYEPLGNPLGQLLHTFRDGDGFLLVTVPQIFKLPAVLLANVAREVGRIAIARAGGHLVDPPDFEADAELAATALGLGVWVANGSYVYENGCCGGGCGVDLKSLRAGLSMPEACFALALDGQRRGLSRRATLRYLEANQRAALKRSWSHLAGAPETARALTEAAAKALPAT